MKLSFTIIFYFYACQLIFSQKQGNIWYFGDSAGINFNTGSPVELTDGVINTDEGCATICDTNGNLLFYTDGITVWNKQHQVMPNGTNLYGHTSSTQSAVIVPIPGYPTKYYIFTSDQGGYSNSNTHGINYSIVDMTLDSANGDVIAKNIHLLDNTVEKITAINHFNKRDIWVIVHKFNSNAFYAYLVTPYGISSPVISTVGTIHMDIGQIDYRETIGYMKASPNGKKIALAVYREQNFVELFDFNNITGVISNPIRFNHPPINNGVSCLYYDGPYGIEFSPNNRFLYVGKVGINSSCPSRVYQYDITAGDSAAIKNSEYIVANYIIEKFGALQLGPDKKIYIVVSGNSFLSAINNPNMPQYSCNFVYNAFQLSKGVCKWGLPTFIQSIYYVPTFSVKNFCYGDTTTFFINDTNGISQVLWNFGDTESGTNNISDNYFPSHVFTKADTFEVELTMLQYGVLQVQKQTIVIIPSPTCNLGPDTILCKGDSILLNAFSPSLTSYKWSTCDTTASIWVKTNATYWVEVANACGKYNENISITTISAPNINLGNDTIICAGDSYQLRLTNSYTNYTWMNGTTTSELTINASGKYWVNANNICGTNSDTITVEAINCNIKIPNVITPNDDIINDKFIIKGIEYSDWQIKIYNRWGTMIYETTKYNNEWPNKEVNSGVYFYILTNHKTLEEYKGIIHLIK